MSERERWIVYPLLFFALGAALRDKFLQQVTTKELRCDRIATDELICRGGVACEGVVVLDPENPDRRLIELGLVEPVAGQAAGGQAAGGRRRLGVLLLRDSEGRELCGVSNNELYVRQINCEGVRVTDPEDPRKVLAGLGSAALPPKQQGGKPQRFGVLALNNEQFGRLVGNPPVEGAVSEAMQSGAEAPDPAGPSAPQKQDSSAAAPPAESGTPPVAVPE
jgi:hypothetical protein